MKLVFYSVVLNHHQAPVADEFYKLLGAGYCFVELINLGDKKGGAEDYSKRPYLLRAWESEESCLQAMKLARTAECCVFGGVDALPFLKERMRLGLFSFDMGERWLKHGWKSLASPRLLKWLLAYYWGGWSNKPIYKLCMSAFAAGDHYKLGTFKGKCYKWGYMPKVESLDVLNSQIGTTHSNELIKSSGVEASTDVSTSNTYHTLMWCGRYLMLKHPELPVLMAQRLKDNEYQFHLDMYGDGEYRERTECLIKSLGLSDYVTIHGNVSNEQVREAMKKSDIFLFTSDRYEGWGAVANESLSCGCVLVASDAIGSSPYLICEGYNGFMFHSAATSTSLDNPDMQALNDLTKKVMWLLDNKEKMLKMQKNAAENMQRFWSPQHAAESLLQLIDDLQNGRESSITEGPCCKV